MRLASNALFALAVVVASLGSWFYVWAHGMACAYSTSGARCSISAPWALGREDFLYLFAAPFGTALLLVIAAFALRRRADNRRD